MILLQGVEFQYGHLGKAIPPPKDRLPAGGNYKEMPEGVQMQRTGQNNFIPVHDGYDQDDSHYENGEEAQEYVQDLMENASAVSLS